MSDGKMEDFRHHESMHLIHERRRVGIDDDKNILLNYCTCWECRKNRGKGKKKRGDERMGSQTVDSILNIHAPYIEQLC